jgi:hypothetical protein
MLRGVKTLILLVGLAVLSGGKTEGSVAGFLTAEVPEFRITNLTLPQAVKVLREEAQKVLGWEPPEVRVVRPEERVRTRDFPFRERD